LANQRDATVKTGLRRYRRTLAALFLFGATVAPAAGADPRREGVALGD
jgi:hypothetical protein